VVTLVGIAAGYIGLVFTVAGSASDGRIGQDVRNIGLGALAVGASLVGVGLLMVFMSMKTDVSQEKRPAPNDAFMRTPLWRPLGAEVSAPEPTFPILLERRF
jgi:hypothetical protein